MLYYQKVYKVFFLDYYIMIKSIVENLHSDKDISLDNRILAAQSGQELVVGDIENIDDLIHDYVKSVGLEFDDFMGVPRRDFNDYRGKRINYKDVIVSNQEFTRFIHRTKLLSVHKIMATGLCMGNPDIYSTATYQSRDLVKAIESYQRSHYNNNAVIVIEFPLNDWESSKKSNGRDNLLTDDCEFAYSIFNTNKIKDLEVIIKPSFILGYIDIRDNSVHLNPSH